MNSDKKELRVNAIKNGTVIDHIPAQDLFKVIKILGLQNITNTMTLGNNLESKTHGHKGIIKISELFFEDDDINRIALAAPNAKLNIIKDYVVVEKRQVQVPDKVVGIAKCVNPKCVTNFEDNITTKFTVVDKENIALKCHYCEKITNKENLRLQ
ncbi:MAG: aspartate carbamoyltransferase regulatory subunit [Bacteroidales bacterium]|nr:aspartate carbamoyltransferase regulatory subunit [Bacteroidales bacterium]